jgi:hypothetical protein
MRRYKMRLLISGLIISLLLNVILIVVSVTLSTRLDEYGFIEMSIRELEDMPVINP